jgi:transaldolase
MAGLELAQKRGIDLRSIQSVASFFISRVDTSVDSALDAIGTERALGLRGSAAISNARVAWQAHVDSIQTTRWQALGDAQVQRPLWASTGVKDPTYSDTRYVLDLVGPGCVNTMPEKTLLAVKEHGQFLGDTLSGMADASASILMELSDVGVNLDSILQDLEVDGVDKFQSAWNKLLETVDYALANGTATKT